MTDVPAIIKAAFPGDDLLHSEVRNALIRVYRCARTVEATIPNIVHYVGTTVEDPPFSIWSGPAIATGLAEDLERLARELRMSIAALNAAQPHWQRFNDSPGVKDVDSVGPTGGVGQNGSEDWEEEIPDAPS